MITKRCCKCHIEKPVDQFSKDRNRKDGSQNMCKECERQYRLINKKQIAERLHKYVRTTERKEKVRLHGKKYRKTPKGKMAQAKAVRKYFKTLKGIDQMIKNVKKYRKTPKGRATNARVGHKRRANGKNVETTLTAAQWAKILVLQNHKCARCERPFDKNNKPTRDHIFPLSKGGGLIFENIEAVCKSCNSSKGTKLDKEKIVTWIYLTQPVTLMEGT